MEEIKRLLKIKRNLIGLIVVLVLLVALPVGIYLAQTTQIFKPRAAEEPGTFSISASPGSFTIPTGSFVNVSINVSAKVDGQEIERVELHVGEKLSSGAIDWFENPGGVNGSIASSYCGDNDQFSDPCTISFTDTYTADDVGQWIYVMDVYYRAYISEDPDETIYDVDLWCSGTPGHPNHCQGTSSVTVNAQTVTFVSPPPVDLNLGVIVGDCEGSQRRVTPVWDDSSAQSYVIYKKISGLSTFTVLATVPSSYSYLENPGTYTYKVEGKSGLGGTGSIVATSQEVTETVDSCAAAPTPTPTIVLAPSVQYNLSPTSSQSAPYAPGQSVNMTISGQRIGHFDGYLINADAFPTPNNSSPFIPIPELTGRGSVSSFSSSTFAFVVPTTPGKYYMVVNGHTRISHDINDWYPGLDTGCAWDGFIWIGPPPLTNTNQTCSNTGLVTFWVGVGGGYATPGYATPSVYGTPYATPSVYETPYATPYATPSVYGTPYATPPTGGPITYKIANAPGDSAANCNGALNTASPRSFTPLASINWDLLSGGSIAQGTTKYICAQFYGEGGNAILPQPLSTRVELLTGGTTPSPTPGSPTATRTPSPTQAGAPSATPRPSATTTPGRTTTEYRIAESLTELTTKPYLPYTTHPLNVTHTFINSNPGAKQICVQFKASDGTESIPTCSDIELVANPEITSCSISPISGIGDITLDILGKNFGTDNGAKIISNNTNVVFTSWTDTKVTAKFTNPPVGQSFPISLTTSNGLTAQGACSSISQLAIGAQLFCPQVKDVTIADTEVTIIEALDSTKMKLLR